MFSSDAAKQAQISLEELRSFNFSSLDASDCCKCNNTKWQFYELKQRFLLRDFDVRPIYKYLCPVLVVICLFSACFNASMILIARNTRSVTSSTNKKSILLLSLNLATTDLIAALLNGYNVLMTYLHVVHGFELSKCGLLAFETLRMAALIASALHLLMLALEHFRGIVYPLRAQ